MLAIGSICGVTRSMIGMNWMNCGLQLVAEEAVDLDRMVGVGRVDGAQDVDVHTVVVQAPPAAHHVVERALAALVDAVGVVQRLRAVDAQADQDLVLLEESGTSSSSSLVPLVWMV